MKQTSRRTSASQLSIIGLMTAILCILGPLSLPLPFSPVPITFANLAIFLAAYVLGMKNGTIACLIYLGLGVAGLPVFSSFGGGLAKLAGPTGGYLIGYLMLALIAGFFIDHFSARPCFSIWGMVLGMASCYLFGTLWLAYQLHQTFAAALMIGVVPYLIGDAIKIAIAAIIGPRIRRAVKSI